MSRMVEVVIDSVRVSLTNQQRIVVLRENGVERYLPIWIGPYEAESITVALQEIEVARPQTHDLLKNAIHMLNGRLVRVEVVSLRDDVFYGNLVVEVSGGQQMNIDCRPSDALALAVRSHVPILVSKDVMDAAGVVPEQEPAAEESRPPHEEAPGLESADTERLSVFNDFLQNLDLDDASNDKPGDGGDEDDDEPDEDRPAANL